MRKIGAKDLSRDANQRHGTAPAARHGTSVTARHQRHGTSGSASSGFQTPRFRAAESGEFSVSGKRHANDSRRVVCSRGCLLEGFSARDISKERSK